MTGSKTVIFLHIPKTAGSTLHSILSWQYLGRPSHWTDRSNDHGESLNSLSREELKSLQLLRGHFIHGVHEKIPGDFTYVTLVRHPLAHVRSQYKYYQEGRWRNQSLEQILINHSPPLLDNVHVRRLAGITADCQNPVLEIQQKHFEQAISNLKQNFSVIGLTDRFDESVILMKHTLGWARPLFYKSAKVNHRSEPRSDMSNRVKKLVLEKNRWDLRLYEWAVDRFDRNLYDEVNQEELKAEKDNLRYWSRVLGPILNIKRKLEI